MKMEAPQIIMVCLFVFNLAIHMAKHGETKEGEKYNAGITFLSIMIETGILWWGGFFG